MSDATLWSIQGEPVGLPLDAWVSSGHPDTIVIAEYRPPKADDLLDGLLQQFAELVDDAARVVDRQLFIAEMRRPLREALALCVDMSCAAWVPTGRTMTVGEARAKGGSK